MSVSTTVTVVLRSVVTALNEGAPRADRLPIATQSGQLGIQLLLWARNAERPISGSSETSRARTGLNRGSRR